MRRIEFRGTRQECIDFLKKKGFTIGGGSEGWSGWGKSGWLAAIEYEKRGDHLGEVAAWENGTGFIAWAWKPEKPKRRDPTRKLRSEESYEDRLDDLGESPDY